MSRHPWDRLVAWLIDWMCVLAWVAVTAAVGVPLFLAGVTDGLSEGALNIIPAVIVVVPVTISLARLESGAREATVGSVRDAFRSLTRAPAHGCRSGARCSGTP